MNVNTVKCVWGWHVIWCGLGSTRCINESEFNKEVLVVPLDLVFKGLLRYRIWDVLGC